LKLDLCLLAKAFNETSKVHDDEWPTIGPKLFDHRVPSAQAPSSAPCQRNRTAQNIHLDYR